MNKSIRKTLACILFLTALLAISTFAQNRAKVGPERRATEKIIREYLLSHPEVVREAMQVLQVKEDKERLQLTTANIKKFTNEIYSDVGSPVLGDAEGDVQIVVFYDYFCGYCRKTLPALTELIAKDPSLKIIYKEFPIMGERSTTAAKAVLAASLQGRFREFHDAMIQTEVVDDEMLKLLAEKFSVDVVRFQNDMNSEQIAAAISRNIKLAENLNISGTPAYLIGMQFVPGAVSQETLASLISEERAKLAANRAAKTVRTNSLD